MDHFVARFNIVNFNVNFFVTSLVLAGLGFLLSLCYITKVLIFLPIFKCSWFLSSFFLTVYFGLLHNLANSVLDNIKIRLIFLNHCVQWQILRFFSLNNFFNYWFIHVLNKVFIFLKSCWLTIWLFVFLRQSIWSLSVIVTYRVRLARRQHTEHELNKLLIA